jgi:DNA-binding transcriptional regulator YiaG
LLQIPKVRTNLYKSEITFFIHRDCTSFKKNSHFFTIYIALVVRKLSNNANSFDFLELGQAIQDAREKQRITRKELAEKLGISARHLQSIEKKGKI